MAVARTVAYEEQQINKVAIEAAPTAEFAARAGRQEGHRRAVPESEQALVLAQPPEELPFQPGPSAIARLVTGIEDPFGTKQTGETTQALQLG